MQSGDQPSFEQLTVYDGVPISYCNSVTKREELKPILESKNFPEYCDEACYNILDSLHEIAQFINNTVCTFLKCLCFYHVYSILVKGCLILCSKTKTCILLSYFIDIVQRRRGCIQSANDIISAFEAWALNGMDFISFDHESQRWTALSPSAITVKQHWDKNKGRNSAFGQIIREQCPLMIQRIKLRSIHQKTGES